jgi:rhodanese-related sulfurtransferase
MSSHTSISQDKLARLIGTAKAPVLIDVRTDEDFAADPRLIPGAVRHSHQDAADWSREYSGMPMYRRKRWKTVSKAGRRQNFRWFPRRNCPRAMRRGARSG